VSTLPLVKLHRHLGAGDIIAKVMCQPATELPQNRQPFGSLNNAVQLIELTG
jgi:hypothetical protein